MRPSRMWQVAAWSCVYVAVTWTRRVYADIGWPYFFFALDTRWAIGWYALLIAMHLAIYTACVCASRGRMRCCPDGAHTIAALGRLSRSRLGIKENALQLGAPSKVSVEAESGLEHSSASGVAPPNYQTTIIDL